MTSDELRAAFLKFYEDKGHKVIPSSSLIPHGDPTLLLTSAGMVQIKPYFLGEAVPSSLRLASCQKCFRATDIESVGDATHNTFFEMLGNFSVGDYFKKETIAWALEFITQHMGLPAERLWASIYLDDEEAFNCWREQGISEEKILRFGVEDNFWGPAGDSGPCGPDTEIFYDYGKEVGCGKPTCGPNCKCGRFIEIGTLVFMQYNQDKSGKRSPLPKPSIDTGMGLERNTAVVQGKASIYETDLFTPLIEGVSKLAGKKYGDDEATDKAMRVVVEHGRALTFLIADGVMPSNEGRGYVLRRLLRRAALYGRRLGLEKPFLNQIAGVTVGSMAEVYPELWRRQNFIYQIIEAEESKFQETLNTGLEILEDIIAEMETRRFGRNIEDEISGLDVFRLYDTYGFPVELTKEIAAQSGFSVNMGSFENEMEKQRERAKSAQKFGLAERVGLNNKLDIKETKFAGYNSFKKNSTILALLVNNDSVGVVQEGQEAALILESTPFYGEMGGQVGDTGVIRGHTGRFSVVNTVRIPPDIITHQGKVIEGSFTVGEEVEAKVDEERRLDIARNHTATHLLQAALRQVLGEHIQQRGSLVAPDYFRFDFSHLVAMTRDEISQVQRIVNERIRQDLEVYDESIPYKQAVSEGAIALFDEKYGDVVRVLRIGKPPISAELCGGTHVTTTGEIGFFHIISESSIGAGLRRIEAVTGRGAERYVNQRLSALENIAELLDSKPDEVVDKTKSLLTEMKNESRRAQTLESELARKTADSLLNQAEVIDEIKLIVARVPSYRIEVLREMSDWLRDTLGSGIIALGSVYEDKPIFIVAVTQDLVGRGYDAVKIVRGVAKVAGGGGGGKPTLAQAGGKNKDKLDEALKQVASLVRELHSS
jgi:alanyl-tRNA synthetase